MISRKDLRISYAILHFLSRICILPVDFDRRNGKERASTCGFKWAIWYLWFISGGLYALYNNVRLAQSYMFRELYVPDHLAFHIQIATFSAVGTFWAYRIRIRHPQVDIAIFNQLFEQDESLRNRAEGNKRRYTIQEWLVLVLPGCMFICCTMVFSTFYWYDSLSIQFLFSMLPEDWRGRGIFSLLWILETGLLEFYLATAYQSIFLQVTARRIYRECMICRQMQLNINLFNDMNSYIIFAVKIYWLTVAIDNYFFGIKFFGSKPILAVAMMFLAVFHTCLFSIMYDTAFSVPRTMQQYKDAIVVVTMGLEDKKRKAEIKRIVESIPQVGVKVGTFHTLERVSTPNFVSYIAEKVSALLITSM